VLLIASLARAQEGAAQRTADWPDTPTTRVEALALLETLNADLLSNDSATLTLDRWCDAHKMASPAKIVAELVQVRRPEDAGQCSGRCVDRLLASIVGRCTIVRQGVSAQKDQSPQQRSRLVGQVRPCFRGQVQSTGNVCRFGDGVAPVGGRHDPSVTLGTEV